MRNKILGFMFLLFCMTLFFSQIYAEAAASGIGGMLSGVGGQTLMTGGLMAAGYLGGQYLTKALGGDNEMAKASGGMASGLATLGGALGGILGGTGWGAIAGIIGSAVGSTVGAIMFAASKDPLTTVDRGVLTRIISLDANNARVFSANYKVAGSDTESDYYGAEYKADKNFIKKDKDTYFEYTPVKITTKRQLNGSGSIPKEVDTAVLVFDTRGLPDYLYKSTGNPGALNPLAAGTQTPVNGAATSVYSGSTTDPFAGALELSDDSRQEMGWCKANDQSELEAVDKIVSKNWVQKLAEDEKQSNQESFVLLLKYLKPQEEAIQIPSYNCLGPNGLLGVTGADNAPKVLYDWSWNTVGGVNTDFCSSGNYYCDSTQFMIFLLKRLEKYNTLAASIDGNVSSTADLNGNSTGYQKQIYDNLNFKTYMMLDGFTQDFLKDFKDYAVNTSYLGFPSDEQEKFSAMLPDKVSFRPLSGETVNPEGYRLPQAGAYNVVIEVTYKDGTTNYELFNNNKISDNVSNIYVYFEPVSQEVNPIYNMPLDATVGVDKQVIDRIGYGVDYSGDSIWFKMDPNNSMLLDPTMRSNSTPIVHLDMVTKADTQSLNGFMKGTVLQIIPKSGANGVAYAVTKYKSLPTYVDLTINKKTEGGAYAYYSIDFGDSGAPQNAGNSFILWNLICTKDNPGCESFNGAKETDDMYLSDKLGVNAKVAPTGQVQGFVYGLEWDKDSIIRDGKHNSVNYRGMVYMPDDLGSVNFNVVIASDSSVPAVGSTQILTSKVDGKLEDIAGIFDRMKNNEICMSKDGSGIRFWWNPAKVMGLAEAPTN